MKAIVIEEAQHTYLSDDACVLVSEKKTRAMATAILEALRKVAEINGESIEGDARLTVTLGGVELTCDRITATDVTELQEELARDGAPFITFAVHFTAEVRKWTTLRDTVALALGEGGSIPEAPETKRPAPAKKTTLSAAARRKIGAATRARWAAGKMGKQSQNRGKK